MRIRFSFSFVVCTLCIPFKIGLNSAKERQWFILLVASRTNFTLWIRNFVILFCQRLWVPMNIGFILICAWKLHLLLRNNYHQLKWFQLNHKSLWNKASICGWINLYCRCCCCWRMQIIETGFDIGFLRSIFYLSKRSSEQRVCIAILYLLPPFRNPKTNFFRLEEKKCWNFLYHFIYDSANPQMKAEHFIDTIAGKSWILNVNLYYTISLGSGIIL